MLIQNNESGNTIRIRFTRDSVSMGDDCMAPHETELLFGRSDTLTDLLNAAAKYVPPMYDFEWEVMCDAEVIGRLISGSETKYQVEPAQTNMKLSDLPEREIFCRKRIHIERISYFDRLEVLYDGVYFSADLFGEYGSARLILEKKETKITTRDKEFAKKHGFKHRELGNYDKILPLDQFEGLKVVRIPNDPHADVLQIDIPKDKILEELKKRLESPHDMMSDGVLSDGVDAGESADCERYGCAPDDADRLPAEKINIPSPAQDEPVKVMKFCPACGTKNNGGKYCSECGTRLLRK